jgi:hypothetical protein
MDLLRNVERTKGNCFMKSTLLGAGNYQGALFPMHAVLPGAAGPFRALAYAVRGGGKRKFRRANE